MRHMIDKQRPFANNHRQRMAGLTVPSRNAPARASVVMSQNITVMTRVAFLLFLFAQFFSLSRKFFFDQFGEQLVPSATIAGVASFLLLPIIWWGYANYAGSPFGFLQRSARPWLATLFLAVSILSVYGWLGHGYNVKAIVHDFGAYLIFLVFIILGSIPRFWKDFLPVALFLTVLAVIVNLYGLQDVDDLLLRYGLTNRVAADLLAYETKAVLQFWPLLLLTVLVWKNRAVRFSIFGIAIFATLQQLLFQKRLPFAESLFYIGVLWFVLPNLVVKWQLSAKLERLYSLRTIFLLTLALAILGVLVFGPEFILGQVTGLTQRYTQQDTSRIDEAVGMVQYLQPHEKFIGRGMGGYFEYTDSRQIAWGEYLEEAGFIGKRNTHVGALMPMLKGGILLMVVFYWGIFQALAARQRCMADMFSFAAWVIIIVKLLVSLQGNFYLSASLYELMLFSICLGRVLTQRRESDYVD